jgi:hypothetical protein
MKKSQILLFFLRLFFYFSVTALILLHPGISVTFDHIGVVQWFIIIPLQALIAFVPNFSANKFTFNLRRRFIISALTLFPLAVWAGGFGPGMLSPLLAGLISFTLTFLLFHHPRWAKPAALEPFFLAWVCLRLLALSRSGEDVAGQSMALTQFIFVWTGVVFLLHGVVVYFCLYPQGRGKAGREGAVFIFSALAVLFVVLVVLPPDFVRNTMIENLVLDRKPEKIKSSADKGVPRGGSGKDRRRVFPSDGSERNPELRGISENDWMSRSGRGRKGSATDNRQYMVMITASEREPVYMGNSFKGQLDPVEGFLVSEKEPLNRIAVQRHFVTWFDNEQDFDTGRKRQEVFSLSTLPQKYLPYRPVIIDPTILSQDSGPLRYIHQVVSNTHVGDPLKLVNVPTRRFSGFESSMLAPYFEVNLDERDMRLFDDYLARALRDWNENRDDIIQNDDYLSWVYYDENEESSGNRRYNEYLEKIIAILVSFNEYQYNMSFNDDSSIASIKDFLFNTKDGDCVEFSNSLALLGRLAGVPSRIVIGYLAARELQTKAHLQGLAALREKIPFLRKFPFENLYMVTNLAHHSWVQFYIPDFGWLDFEATTFSIPPMGTGDFNTWDVVIPLINENKIFSQVRKFPWLAVLRAAGVLAGFALVCAYILRYAREAVLYFGARRGGRAGARSLYLLLLARLAADGRPIKPASKTALEYSQLFTAGLFNSELSADQMLAGAQERSHFKTFASLYTELRWREFADPSERDKRFLLLKQEYRSILKTTRRRGLRYWFIRLFSLRGLAYL